ncbi:SulP family inorganic anion transporter [Cellulomonas soli]|uniref:Transporter n=1 Tax=Cellulomonas soli TaxID=931535 RepID=A0A512PAT9_9CELL|nr:SulP family inorganic anion transporter [Cellulomonas soli]NYI57411.1 high affinity sulfate transporter 1 [Cellulomonas soli]GEP68308.1 transporter [Cellulomonas soli]
MDRGRFDRLLPGIATARRYERAWLRADLTAGLTLVALAIPAGMAYAQAAGLPPVTGLYATIVPLTVYALVGPSRVLVLGPDSSLAPMIAAAVLPLALGDPDRAVALAGTLALLMGAMLVIGRLLHLGFVTALLSKPIRVGYLNGIALVVITSQLPRLLGVSVPGGSIWEELGQTVQAVAAGELDVAATVLGVGSLAVIVLARMLRSPVPGIAIAVVAATVATAALGLADQVPVVGALPQGLPAPALAGVRSDDVLALVAPAAGIALIAFADTGVLSRTLAGVRGESVDGDREMGALGLANAATGLLGGFPVSSSASRTPVAVQAGARTQLVGVVAAAALVAFMVLVPGLTATLPTSALAAVVIAAASTFVDVRTFVRLVGMSRTEAALLLAAFLGVAFVGVLPGILVAIALSLADFVRHAWDPYRAELGSLEGVPGYHDLSRHPEGQRVPGLVIVRFDAPLFFANGDLFDTWVRDVVEGAPAPVHQVVVAAEPLTGVDSTAIDELVELDDHLARLGVDLVFAEMKGPVKDRLVRYGVGARFGPDHFFPTVHSAVREYRRTWHV